MFKFEQSSPIYIQIMQKLKADIVSGKLKGGEKMPSVRELSETFQVNPNTVQRVFIELEREGITYSQRGIGTFVAEGAEVIDKLKTTQAESYANRFADEMLELGLVKKEIYAYLEKILEGSKAMMILEANGVCKKYLRKPALNGIDITIESGKIVGLLGPNGSGKTTFLKLLAGLSRSSAGSIKICHTEIGCRTKALVAYLPDRDYLYPWMKISDAKKVYATFFSDFNPMKFDELLDFMKLESGMSVKSLSRGMTEKLALALTLARDAKLIVLDEPLNGVDPIAREEILGAILKGFNYESSIIIASHLINEVERILDEAHFLVDGKIILSGNAEEIRSEKKMTLDEVYREVCYVG